MQTTVLFADLSGSGKLRELAGQAVALKATVHCVERLRRAAESAGGQVVKAAGDQIMALFPSPDAAASAAARMHAAIGAVPALRGAKLAVHVGFHTGPVIQRDHDLLGDTVKLASRLLKEAQDGQTVTSPQTAALLGPAFRAVSRPESIAFGVGEEKLRPCEIVVDAPRPHGAATVAEVRLSYRNQVFSCSPENELIVIGRNHGCGLVVTDSMASRRHCTIRLRRYEYVLQDHSSNGTYLTIAGEKGVLLKGESLPLAKHGSIAFGPKRFADSELLEFACVIGL